MSRMGKIPVTVPAGVTVTVADGKVTVKGQKGSLTMPYRKDITIKVENGKVIFSANSDSKFVKALHGTYRALVNSMIKGVTTGFEKNLEINGVGYRARLEGRKLVLQVGKSHEIDYDIPEGLKVEVEKNVNIKVTGADKHLVGQWAAAVRSAYPPEPYQGKGIRYKGEHVRRKAGKKVVGTA